MAERRIWLVRHGETEWSKSGQHTGRTNIALTANGERQAKALGKLLAGKKFALVLASPMGRAQATARLAGINEFEVTEDLHEWNYGIYEGITTKSVREKQPNWRRSCRPRRKRSTPTTPRWPRCSTSSSASTKPSGLMNTSPHSTVTRRGK